ncbi:MAG: hypothetical protein WCT08_00960 [Patescibacteria group bacterium]|jgi:DNA polymerase-4
MYNKTSKQPFENLSPRHYLYISINHFAASVEEALNPQFRNVPLAIIENINSELTIVDCNVIAASFGIKKGMSLKKAFQITPRLVIRPIQSGFLKGFSRAFIKISKKWGEFVMEKNNEILLTIPYSTSIERAIIFLKIQNACWQELECKVNIGFGSSPTLAKLANLTLRQPGFQFYDKNDAQTLNRIPIRFLPGLGQSSALRLKESGIAFIGEFLNAKTEDVYSWLGKKGLALRYQVTSSWIGVKKPEEIVGSKAIGLKLNKRFNFNFFNKNLASVNT